MFKRFLNMLVRKKNSYFKNYTEFSKRFWDHKCHIYRDIKGSPGGSDGKESACNARDTGLIPGDGNGNPLQYSCLGNLMDRGA